MSCELSKFNMDIHIGHVWIMAYLHPQLGWYLVGYEPIFSSIYCLLSCGDVVIDWYEILQGMIWIEWFNSLTLEDVECVYSI